MSSLSFHLLDMPLFRTYPSFDKPSIRTATSSCPTIFLGSRASLPFYAYVTCEI